jgi:hypothetical protein
VGLVINENLVSSLIISETAAVPNHIVKVSLAELLIWQGVSIPSGEIWEAWAFNGGSFEPSIYSGFSFNSYAFEGGVAYAAKEEGIYVLDGVTDAGAAVHTGVILSSSNFGSQSRKRFRAGFFDITGAAPVIRADTDSGQGASTPILRKRTSFPRTLVGSKWMFLIADFDELGQVELFPIILTR